MIISIVFLSNTILYAYPVSKDSLRAPLEDEQTYQRMRLVMSGESSFTAHLPAVIGADLVRDGLKYETARYGLDNRPFTFEALMRFARLPGLIAFTFLSDIEVSLQLDTITPGQAMMLCLEVLSKNPGTRTIKDTGTVIGSPDLIGTVLEYLMELSTRYTFALIHHKYYDEYREFMAKTPLGQLIYMPRYAKYLGPNTAFDLLIFELYLGSQNKLPIRLTNTTYYEVMFDVLSNNKAPLLTAALARWAEENYFYADLPPNLKGPLELWAIRHDKIDALDSRETLEALIMELSLSENIVGFLETLRERVFYTTTGPGRYDKELLEFREIFNFPDSMEHLDIGCSTGVTTKDINRILRTGKSIGIDVLPLSELREREQADIISKKAGVSRALRVEKAGESRVDESNQAVEIRQVDITNPARFPRAFIRHFNLVTAFNSVLPNVTDRERITALALMYSALLPYQESQKAELMHSVMLISGCHFITSSALDISGFQLNTISGLDLTYLVGHDIDAGMFSTIVGQEAINAYILGLDKIKGSEMRPTRFVKFSERTRASYEDARRREQTRGSERIKTSGTASTPAYSLNNVILFDGKEIIENIDLFFETYSNKKEDDIYVIVAENKEQARGINERLRDIGLDAGLSQLRVEVLGLFAWEEYEEILKAAERFRGLSIIKGQDIDDTRRNLRDALLSI